MIKRNETKTQEKIILLFTVDPSAKEKHSACVHGAALSPWSKIMQTIAIVSSAPKAHP